MWIFGKPSYFTINKKILRRVVGFWVSFGRKLIYFFRTRPGRKTLDEIASIHFVLPEKISHFPTHQRIRRWFNMTYCSIIIFLEFGEVKRKENQRITVKIYYSWNFSLGGNTTIQIQTHLGEPRTRYWQQGGRLHSKGSFFCPFKKIIYFHSPGSPSQKENLNTCGARPTRNKILGVWSRFKLCIRF